jgi:SAM-dependent methyltransferase
MDHYNENYFSWQSPIGAFGGWANLSKFAQYVHKDDIVLDFGCGGGFLLKNLNCKKKIGVDINRSALEIAEKNGIETHEELSQIPDDSIDIVVSDNALEHTLHPFEVLTCLIRKLRIGGKAVFVVPCESISMKYEPENINQHLYSWSPMCIGNVFSKAGFAVIESKPYVHKWPPFYNLIARIGGRAIFELTSRVYGRIERSWFQIRIVAERPDR